MVKTLLLDNFGKLNANSFSVVSLSYKLSFLTVELQNVKYYNLCVYTDTVQNAASQA